MIADTYEVTEQKEWETEINGIQRQSVLDFCHSDQGSYIESNSHKAVMISGVDHAALVWSVMIMNEQYKLFNQSDIIDEF